MIIKRFKIGFKRLAAGIFTLLALSGFATRAGEKALADGIRDWNNVIIVGGVTLIGCATYGLGWLVFKGCAEAAEVPMNLNTDGKKAAYKTARRVWLASLASALTLGVGSGLVAASVIRNDEYNRTAQFTAGVLGGISCCAAAGTIYKII